MYDHYNWNWQTYDYILQCHADSDNWETAGHMMEERSSHGVLVMDTEDFSDYCSVASVTAGEVILV